MLRTLTLSHPDGDVTLGWANMAKLEAFAKFIENKMQRGFSYMIVRVTRRSVIYNAATIVDCGVTPHSLALLKTEMGDFLAAGDISVVRLGNDPGQNLVRAASTAQEVLDHDTFEIRP